MIGEIAFWFVVWIVGMLIAPVFTLLTTIVAIVAAMILVALDKPFRKW